MCTIKKKKMVEAKLKRSRRNRKDTGKNCTRKVLMNQITMMVWSATQNQIFWSVKSSGPEKALMLIKLADAMELQ